MDPDPGRVFAQGETRLYLPFTVESAELPAQSSPTPPATSPPGEATLPAPYPVAWPPPEGPDALAETLDAIGAAREDLGYRPRGDWTRFPLPERTAYLLPMFEPVYEDPLRAYAVARTMGAAADRYLHPYAVKDANLFRATYYLGLDRMAGNFRDYSVNTLAQPASADPLREAIRDVYQYAREDLVHFSFGGVTNPGNVEAVMDRELAGLPEGLSREVARGLLNQLEAIKWRDRGLRRVDPELARSAFAIRDLGDTQGDGTIYYAQIDDVMEDLDEPSLYYGGQKAVETAQQLRLGLASLDEAERCPGRRVDVPTPFGRLVIGTCGDDLHEGDDVLLSVDPGGNDQHLDNAGGTSAIEIPVAIAVDLSGDDVYDCTAMDQGPCQGAGVLGHGVLIDADGQDRYAAGWNAQGLGFLGEGLLFDGAGHDEYRAVGSAQGAGYFGYGALMDGSGDDRYEIFFDGQGYGGVGGGVGVLADRSGNDAYYAEPDVRELPQEYRYRNYAGNGQPNTVISFVQGASAGRRADGSDGHSWPGGLGAIIDVMGDDRYTAGAFAQAYGYWYGIGTMYDGAGDDVYQSVYYSIASGAHYSVSAIVDEAGDDRYVQSQEIEGSTAGAGVAFAWDFVNALIFDRSGDDHYESRVNALARSAEKGNAMLIDGGGADTYVIGGVAREDGSWSIRRDGMGSSRYRSYVTADPYRAYLTGYESGVFSLLLDLGGSDRYLAKDFATGATTEHDRAADGATWYEPEPDAVPADSPIPDISYRMVRLHGLGVDRDNGRIPEFDRWPPPPTPAPTSAPNPLSGDGAASPATNPDGMEASDEAPPGQNAAPSWTRPDPDEGGNPR